MLANQKKEVSLIFVKKKKKKKKKRQIQLHIYIYFLQYSFFQHILTDAKAPASPLAQQSSLSCDVQQRASRLEGGDWTSPSLPLIGQQGAWRSGAGPSRGISPSDWPGASRVTGAQRRRRSGESQQHKPTALMASRRMETKPVITCLKTLLIVYSFVFWVSDPHSLAFLSVSCFCGLLWSI